MAESKNYPKEFVENTIEILKQLDKPAREIKLEVTFFMNCLLGLIVTTLENLNRKKELNLTDDNFKVLLSDTKIKKFIPRKIMVLKSKSFSKSLAEELDKFKFLENLGVVKTKLETIDVEFMTISEIHQNELKWLLKLIRNGIAHQHIMPTAENKEWKGVRIYNYSNNGLKNFAIEFTIKELRLFSKMIAERYLACFKEEKADNT